jgi:hypothetical protein
MQTRLVPFPPTTATLSYALVLASTNRAENFIGHYCQGCQNFVHAFCEHDCPSARAEDKHE